MYIEILISVLMFVLLVYNGLKLKKQLKLVEEIIQKIDVEARKKSTENPKPRIFGTISNADFEGVINDKKN